MKRTRRIQSDKTVNSSAESSGGEAKMCHFDQLSDAVLAKIFKCLDLEDLVKLRQVCRKWNQMLTTSEDFWKNCQLFYGSETWTGPASAKINFWKCWRMAPVLHRASFDIDWREKANFTQRLLEKCPSSVKSLHFTYDNMPPATMFSLLKTYGNTVEELLINDTMTPYVVSDIKRIWMGIQSLTKLKHLIIDGASLLYHKATLSKAMPCWQTLKILDVKDSSYEDMNSVQRIISMHHNWTEVYLSSSVELARGEVKALSKCTELESVQVPFCKEFKFLLNCEKLDSLILDCTDKESEIKQVLSALKKKSPCFPNLKGLKMSGGSSEYVPLLKSILMGCPNIRLLNLVNEEMEAAEMLEVLSCAPALEKLFLHEVQSDFIVPVLNGLASGLVSSLKKVALYECDCDKECIKVSVNQFKEKQPHVKISADCNC